MGLFLGSFAALAPTASAAKCPSGKSDGKTIGTIKYSSISVPVKSVTYPVSGELNPPVSPSVAGVSARHNPLSAKVGSSIIVWHISNKGCNGKLNPIVKSKKGAKVTITDENGAKRNYKVTDNLSIPIGSYKAKWFRLDGVRQLVFVTCGGKVVNKRFTRNLVVIAVPA
jgi:hypothetical protein